MLGRCLEYQSLKTVLLHMDANVRFQISLHMPTIKNVEKVVPLKINKLHMSDCSTKVNDSIYAVGVHRQYPEGDVTEKWTTAVRSKYDYDEFGFPLVSGVDILLPGDVSFRQDNQQVRFDTEEDERMIRRGLRYYEENLSEDPVFHASCIEARKQELLPFDCRRNNTKRPFDCYIEVAILKKEGQYQRFEYNKKLFEAAKYLNEVLFGGRRVPIQVGKFDFAHRVIYRLPVGFRLQIQKISPHHNGILHKSFPSMVENAKSLNCLTVEDRRLPNNAHECPIIRNAKRLVIGRFYWNETPVPLLNMESLPNPEICILQNDQGNSPGSYLTMIYNWLDGWRAIGHSLWIQTEDDDDTGRNMANDVLRLLKIPFAENMLTEIITSDGSSISTCTTFPLNSFARLEIRSVPFKKASWMLKVKILEV